MAPLASFSLKEAVVLSRLPEDRVRREIERKVVAPGTVSVGAAHRLRFAEPEILFFAMLNFLSNTVELSPSARAKACRMLIDWEPVRLKRIKAAANDDQRFEAARINAWRTVHRNARFRDKWTGRLNREWSKRISAVVSVNWNALIDDVAPRIELYREGRKRIHEDGGILGGEPVFKGTRLAVRHIGGMRAKGEPVERILADYPELTRVDVEFARLYTEAHPPVGRPKAEAVTA